jgi:hypothetical protein
MTAEFQLPVSGFVPSLPKKWKDAICKKFPVLEISRIQGVFASYLLYRDGSSHHPSPEQARKMLTRATGEAETLISTVRSFGPLKFLVRAAAVENAAHLDSFEIDLIVASAAFRSALKLIPKGRPVSPRTRLVRMLAAELQDKQINVDSSASGDLSILTAILLEAAGERPDGAPKIVRDAFGKRKKSVQK